MTWNEFKEHIDLSLENEGISGNEQLSSINVNNPERDGFPDESMVPYTWFGPAGLDIRNN